MKKILILFFITSFGFSQESCDKITEIYSELIEIHENELIDYCNSIEEKAAINPNLSVEQAVKNQQQFIGNYLNKIMYNFEGKELIKQLRPLKKKSISCLKDETISYEIKDQFNNAKTNVKDQTSSKFHKLIDILFNKISKRIL